MANNSFIVNTRIAFASRRTRGSHHFSLDRLVHFILVLSILFVVAAHVNVSDRSARFSSGLVTPGFVGLLTCCTVLKVPSPRSSRAWTGHDRSPITLMRNNNNCCCCFHFRRKNSEPPGHEHHLFRRLFCASFSDDSVPLPNFSSSLHCEDRDKTENMGSNCDPNDTDGDTVDLFSSSAFLRTSLSSSPIQTRTQDTDMSGKRIHYNDALLKRILNGRSSSSERWRRRTRRAAAALGINFTSSISANSFFSPLPYWPLPNRREDSRRGIQAIVKMKKHSKGPDVSSSHPKYVPPITSALKCSSQVGDDATSLIHSNHTSSSSSSSRIRESFSSNTKGVGSHKSKAKPSSNLLYVRPRNTPLTREEYDKAKKEWTERYTNISNLRSTFGTNRNKLWGDFDPETTRRLYKTLLPRALLGLYEMGLWSPTDLAPLAYEARLAAKKYARERCVVPGRLMSMVYDGFRSWRDWGTWNVEGMSWEQVWYKYETQIMGELCKSSGANSDNLNVMQEEITALVCLRILERSCITNEAIDKLILREKSTDAPVFLDETGNNNKYNLRKRNRKAERDIARISAQLERDMEELLKTPVVSASTMMKWTESVSSSNVTTYNPT